MTHSGHTSKSLANIDLHILYKSNLGVLMRLLKTVLPAMLLALSANVSASVVSADWNTANDGLITNDTVTGLNWLDLTETNGLSYNYVSSQLGAGGDYEGFRYATNDEVVGLWTNFWYNLSYNTPEQITNGGSPEGLINATNLLGNTVNEFNSDYQHGVVGFTSDTLIAGSHTRLGVYQLGSYMYINDVVDGLQYADDTAYLYNASYLVEDESYVPSTVPVPAAAWLFGSALLGFFGFSRRKANA